MSLTRVDSCDVTCPNCCRPFVVSVSIDGPWPDLPEGQQAGGPPTPDLADSPDSTPPLPKPEAPWNREHRIGVYDYPSLVSCLRENYKMLFPDGRFTDPQDMIQLMTAAIQALRSLPR